MTPNVSFVRQFMKVALKVLGGQFCYLLLDIYLITPPLKLLIFVMLLRIKISVFFHKDFL